MKKIIFTNEEIDLIKNKYLNENYSLQKIAVLFNTNRKVIKQLLVDNQVQIRDRTHTYYADYSIFHTIDTPEKAYWLGFLAADGCNYSRKTNAMIIINLAKKDREQLEKFQKFMKTNAKITDYVSYEGYSSESGTEMSKIVLNSKEMSQDLNNLGIVPKKSLILQPPKIDKQFYLPFILGYFDGDGSIYYLNKSNIYGLSIEGTKEMLNWINNLLQISSSLEKRYNDNQNNYYIRCGGTNKPYLILKQLYDSCDIHLNRKYNIYKSLETVVLNRNIK